MAERRPIGSNRRSARSESSSGSGRKFFYSGDEGMRNTEAELEKQKQRREAAEKGFGPLRFFVPAGETKEGIIVDDKPDFFLYEHATRNPVTKRFDLFTGCVKSWDNCPACEAWGESTWVMYLTVIDLTPFKDRNDVKHEFSRKLLVVKPSQQKKFIRRYEKEGTLRGALFSFTRDSKNSAAIGNDIELIEYVDEDELATYTRTWVDKDKKRHEEDCSEPYDYSKLIEEPTVERLLELTGAEPAPGSRSQRRRDLGSDDDADGWDKDDDAPWDKEAEAPSRTSRRAATSRRGAEEEEEAEERTSSRRPPPSRRSARRDEPEEEEEAPKTRRVVARPNRNR